MTLEEKAKFIEESKEKNYLFISPKIIKGGATLVGSYEALELYENMDENTKKFAEKEIVNLISRQMEQFAKRGYDVLDKIRALDPSVNLSLSIGIGRGAKTLREAQDMAVQALDMAQGRGGDVRSSVI